METDAEDFIVDTEQFGIYQGPGEGGVVFCGR